MFVLLAYSYVAGILASFIAAVWTGDLRWLATGLIMIAVVVVLNIMNKWGSE